jgi:ADP-ribose pyrophosphatase
MKKLTEKIVFEGQWLFVQEAVFENKQGSQYTWEIVHRKRSTVGVVVVARMKGSKKFILIKQYRPAIGGYLLSFPAGLGFNDPQHALVELKEETGYTGKIIEVSPILKTGASLINDSARIVCVEVDEHSPENKNPVQNLEPAEDIEVCLVSQEDGHQYILDQETQGVHIAANLWYVFGCNMLRVK